MQLGLIGLGKMGGNMRERIRRAGHEVVGFDRDPKVSDVKTLAGLVKALDAPRTVWVMGYAARCSGALVAAYLGVRPAQATPGGGQLAKRTGMST